MTDHQDAKAEGRYHTYETHHIPWYVRMIWVGFWGLAIWYIIAHAIPAAKQYF